MALIMQDNMTESQSIQQIEQLQNQQKQSDLNLENILKEIR
jgi:hypothetical protein